MSDERPYERIYAWHHYVAGWCNHIESNKGDGCHRDDGTWTPLVAAPTKDELGR